MKRSVVFVFFASLFLLFSLSRAAEQRGQLVRQYPIAGAREVSPSTSIGLTARVAYDRNLGRDENTVTVSGTRSGVLSVSMRLSDDARTIILTPISPFLYNEVVTVHVRLGLVSGASVNEEFHFTTMRAPIQSPLLLARLREEAWLPQADTSAAIEDTLPPLNVLVDRGATPGSYYFANFGMHAPNHNHLLTLDEHGTVLRLQNKVHNLALDFKLQPHGEITYFDNAQWNFVRVDSDWNMIDTFRSANGYLTDQHELLVLPDGGYALMAVSITHLDSDQYVAGMVPNAVIGGNVIQIFDAHGNETFEWRGIDHYRVADAVHEKLGDSAIDFQHANSLDIDANGDIIISNRHLSEITRISGETGAILWRLGGAHNQFRLLGDSIWFSYQHAARLLPNENLTLFDNADYDSVTGVVGYIRHSRALELALDTTAWTATVVWQWHHTPETFSVAMGNVQRLPNGSTVIGWGLNYDQAITEVGRDGLTLFELSLGAKNVSYRVFKALVPDSLLAVASSGVRQASALHPWLTTGTNGGTVHFTLPRAGSVTISVYDALGREVMPSVMRQASDIPESVALGRLPLSPGSYFCTVRSASGQFGVAPFVVEY